MQTLSRTASKPASTMSRSGNSSRSRTKLANAAGLTVTALNVVRRARVLGSDKEIFRAGVFNHFAHQHK
jgi:hypothetical protein